jgi:hypothetical protein
MVRTVKFSGSGVIVWKATTYGNEDMGKITLRWILRKKVSKMGGRRNRVGTESSGGFSY